MRVIRPSNVGPCGRKFMKIAILSRNPRLYSTRRLVEAGEARGHEMHVIDTLKCYMDITPGNPTIWYMGEKLEGFDRSEEHTSELQSRGQIVCRLLHEKKNY